MIYRRLSPSVNIKSSYLGERLPYNHEPILDYATDLKVSQKLGWTAAPSKSLFLKSKSGKYSVFVTHKDTRFDQKKIMATIGERVSICSNDVMHNETGCLPGALSPFTLDNDIQIIFDVGLLNHKEVMFTPADPSYTVIFDSDKLIELFEMMENNLFLYS